jgi:hypothetical protein
MRFRGLPEERAVKSSIKIHGLDQIHAALRHAGQRVSDTARKTMHAGADAIVRDAKLNAPVDERNLEKSIRKEIAYGFRGRLEIDVVVGGFVNGVNVDHYAALIHEHYSSMKPGPGTIAKQAANPQHLVGEKFLERAVRDNRTRLERDLVQAVFKEWRL